ncbi:MAG: alpha/beta hydrolase [Bryobacteraceae bacterium]
MTSRFVPGSLPVTVLLLHETGGDENDLLPVGRALVPGAALLSPRLSGTHAEDLAQWIGATAQQYGLDPAKIYALGYSSGADLAIATMLFQPGVIAGGLLLRPTRVVAPEPLPNLKGAPILIVAGKSDTAISPSDAEALARLLTQAGAAVDFALNDASHDLTPQDFGLGKKWFGQWLITAASELR